MKKLFKWLFLIVHILLHANHIEQCAGDAHSINSLFYNGFDGMQFVDHMTVSMKECLVLIV